MLSDLPAGFSSDRGAPGAPESFRPSSAFTGDRGGGDGDGEAGSTSAGAKGSEARAASTRLPRAPAGPEHPPTRMVLLSFLLASLPSLLSCPREVPVPVPVHIPESEGPVRGTEE